MKRIGNGRTAEVFERDDGRVLKLFNAGYPLDAVEREAHNALLVNTLSLPAPRCWGRCDMDGRYGIVYDRVTGSDLLGRLMDTYAVEDCTKVLTALHKTVLACDLPEAEDYREILRRSLGWVQLEDGRRRTLLDTLERLPGGDTFCHGDFHYGNVMETAGGSVLIDMMNVCRGVPLYDIARSYYLICMGDVPESVTKEFLDAREQAGEIYLREMGVERGELSEYLALIAAVRPVL